MIQLYRDIQVRTFEAEATVAVGRDRPEFLAVARLAADLGYPIGGQDISRELLGNLPVQVGWRVLERALALGLLEREGHKGPAQLSPSGRLMLEQGAVLVPEEGVWRFHLVDDPLVLVPLVHVERIDADHAKDERNRLYGRQRGDRPEQGLRPPPILSERVNELLRSAHDGSAFELRDLGERGQEGPAGSLRLSLRWASNGAPVVKLNGTLPSAEEGPHPSGVDATLPAAPALSKLAYPTLLVALIQRAAGVDGNTLVDWMNRASVPVLPTTMARWPEAVRRSFQCDLQVPATTLDEIGSFEPSELGGVPLVAASDAAAQEWAEWLLWNGIATYVIPNDIDELSRKIAGQFPLHRPRLPDAQELLARARSQPNESTSRFLLTPADLGLWS